MAKDSCIKLQATPLGRREDSKHEEFPGSNFDDTGTGTSRLDHGDNFDREDPKKIPKWWHDTIGDVQIGEMIEGQSSRNKSKKPNMVNFSLMANV